MFDVKSDGWFHLLKAMGDMPLGATVVFSSIAGRFGNGGQADYSAANDLLCKYVELQDDAPRNAWHRDRLDSVGGHRHGIRGSIPKMMEMARIDMLAPQLGSRKFDELVSGFGGEVIVGGRLGIPARGLGRNRWARSCRALTQATAGPMGSRIIGMGITMAFASRPISIRRRSRSSTITRSTEHRCSLA